jgi:hypothetical protein
MDTKGTGMQTLGVDEREGENGRDFRSSHRIEKR